MIACNQANGSEAHTHTYTHCVNIHVHFHKVLYLPPNSGYEVFKPIQNGVLNVTPSSSLSSVLSQLEDLWTRAIEEYLDLPRKDFKVLLVMC